MANHRLSLEIPETLSGCILRIQDTSTYTVEVTPKCAQLQISIPGFKNSVYIDDINPNFSVNLTACDLKIQKDNCGSSFNDLPDGIYVIKYSVSPNNIVFVEYSHLRMTKALNRVQSIYCDLDLENCVSNAEKKKQLENVKTIQQYLWAAKANVEFCRSASKGLELYKQANKMLDKFSCKNCY